MPEFVEKTIVERNITCKYCGNSDLFQNGSHKHEQYYLCNKCGHRATGKDTFPKQKYDKRTIVEAMTYYYNGMSYGGIKNTFDDLGIAKVSTSTLWEWIMKYTNLVIPFSRDIKLANIGNSWVADETMIMMHGKNKWLWVIIDEETRYLLACNFTSKRMTKDAERLFLEAYLHARRRPDFIYTDKLQAYGKAFKHVFGARGYDKRVFHGLSEGFASKSNTNLIERWHEYVKQRTKIMRHFKIPESADIVLHGIIINYNYLWEHSTLGYITPAQKAGINQKELKIKNWGDLIELAIKFENEQPKRNQNEFMFWLDEQIKLGRM